MSTMNVFAERIPIFPWSPDQIADRQFTRMLQAMLLLFLLVALVVPLLPLPPVAVPPEPDPPPQLTRLLIEKRVVKPPPIIKKPKPIKPKPAKPKVAKKKPVVKKTPPKAAPVKKAKAPIKKQQSAVQARKKAASSGLLALQRQLVSMRESANQSQVGRKVLSKKGSQAPGAKPAIKASSARSSSGGIDSALLSDASKSSGLAGRSSSAVTSSMGGQSTSSTSSGGGVLARSIEEIRKVFDANKGAIFAIYNRALRKNPGLEGKVVLELVIEPSGMVSLCRVVTSELADASMERKLASRVRMFQFLAKSVSVTRIKYPVDFLPS